MLVPVNEHIRHLTTQKEGTLLEQVASLCGLSENEARALIEIGAVYLWKFREDRAQKLIPTGAYLRVHLHPRFYPVGDIDWKATVVEENEDYLVLNKPAGIPLIPTINNTVDNVLNQLSKLFRKKLLVTSRLDRPTRGLVVFAKTPQFQSRFNKLLIKRLVEKRYCALTEKAPQVGEFLHFMEPKRRSPMTVSKESKEGWLECRLIVNEVREKRTKDRLLYESEIQLLTGRTHQIRVQFAHEGHPIVGDTLYGGTEISDLGLTSEAMGLMCRRLAFLGKVYELSPNWL